MFRTGFSELFFCVFAAVGLLIRSAKAFVPLTAFISVRGSCHSTRVSTASSTTSSVFSTSASEGNSGASAISLNRWKRNVSKGSGKATGIVRNRLQRSTFGASTAAPSSTNSKALSATLQSQSDSSMSGMGIVQPIFASRPALEQLLLKVRSLPTTAQQRAVAAVVGASVADAATRPMHWLYDR